MYYVLDVLSDVEIKTPRKYKKVDSFNAKNVNNVQRYVIIVRNRF